MHGGFNKEREKLMRQSLAKQFGKDVLKEIDTTPINPYDEDEHIRQTHGGFKKKVVLKEIDAMDKK
jgi:hypothetical protein